MHKFDLTYPERGFTRSQDPPLVLSMDTYEAVKELAYFDYLEAREKALDAATGHFVASNVPDEHLRIISDSTTDEVIALAARLALHRRGVEHERRPQWE